MSKPFATVDSEGKVSFRWNEHAAAQQYADHCNETVVSREIADRIENFQRYLRQMNYSNETHFLTYVDRSCNQHNAQHTDAGVFRAMTADEVASATMHVYDATREVVATYSF